MIALLNQGGHLEAEEQAHALLEAFPLSGKAWQILGHALHAQGKPAIHALERAVSLLPDDSEAHYNLGLALAREDRFEEAVASYQQALVLNPWFPNAHCYLGATWRKLGRFEEALESFRAALAIDPTHDGAPQRLQEALTRVGRLVEAEELCRRTLSFKPDTRRFGSSSPTPSPICPSMRTW